MKSDIIFFIYQKILKYFSEILFLKYQNFSVLKLKWSQAMEMKKARHFFMGHIKIWYHFPLATKCQNISMTVTIGTFQFHYKREHKYQSEMKLDAEIWRYFSLFATWYYFELTFKIYFLISFIWKIYDNSSERTTSFV